MLAALASALAARDPSTAAHCSRVTFMAGRVAVWLGWDQGRLRALRLGGPLHDIGKVMISDTILRKRGPLRPEEVAEIQTHPAAGVRLIGPVWPAQEALPYVLYHTSAGTAAATRAASAVLRFPRAHACSPSPMRSMR
jgi:HD-GYP domain-containing protein (c-di-GMP phosphodiesterase class II)